MKNKVIIIEDDLEFSNIQKDYINTLEGFICENCYNNPVEFLDTNQEFDILLLDLVTPKMNGLEAIVKIADKYPKASIVINSIKDDVDVILYTLKKGAVGYIDKQNFYEYIKEVLQSVSNEGAFMTPTIAKKIFDFFQNKNKKLDILTKRELEVVDHIIEGLSYKLIADELNLSIDTIRMHIRNIYRKFRINSKSELISIISGIGNKLPKI